jgi:two-component system sensor histidine kinase SenX3
VAVIDDISERRRLDAVRRDFVANISHELKTPVGALGVLSEAIADAEDPDVVRRLADRMTDEALRAGRIIDDLLALARIESEETTSRDHVRIGDVVSEAVQRMVPLAEARRIAIDCDEVGAAHAVVGDPRQLVSAVANLIENACKYSDEGSGVNVRSRKQGRWIELDVVDGGIGIPSTDLDRVFERFYRVDRARSRETGGTGLGLAIVRHVATNHGGDVQVTSTEGLGSTFTLRLPIGALS